MGVCGWKGNEGPAGRDVGGWRGRCRAAAKPPLCRQLCLLTCQISPARPCLQTLPRQCQRRLGTASSQRHLVAEKETRRWKSNCPAIIPRVSPGSSGGPQGGGMAVAVAALYLTCWQRKGFGAQGDWSPSCPLPKYGGERNRWANSPSLKIPHFTYYSKSICFVFVVRSSGVRNLNLKLTS